MKMKNSLHEIFDFVDIPGIAVSSLSHERRSFMARKKNKKKKIKLEIDEQDFVLEEEAAPEVGIDASLISEEDADILIPAPPVEIPRSEDFTSEDFESSVQGMTLEAPPKPEVEQEDAEKASPKKKRSRAANIIQIAMIVFFAGVFLVSIVLLGENIWGKIEGSKEIEEVQEMFKPLVPGENSSGIFDGNNTLACLGSDNALQTLLSRLSSGKGDGNVNNSSGYDVQLEDMRASLSALKETNSDVYGWIYVEDTRINYPILRGPDNDYYLDHGYNRNYLPIGSIFLDFATKDTLTDNYNAVLYGHNVAAGNMMFHDMTKFLNEEFFASARIYIYTMDGVYIYKPVSIYQTKSDYFYFRVSFPSEEEFLAFAAEVVSNSKFPAGETFASGDTMITLSTCTNGAPDGRYALHAKLIEVIQ